MCIAAGPYERAVVEAVFDAASVAAVLLIGLAHAPGLFETIIMEVERQSGEIVSIART